MTAKLEFEVWYLRQGTRPDSKARAQGWACSKYGPGSGYFFPGLTGLEESLLKRNTRKPENAWAWWLSPSQAWFSIKPKSSSNVPKTGIYHLPGSKTWAWKPGSEGKLAVIKANTWNYRARSNIPGSSRARRISSARRAQVKFSNYATQVR